MDRCFSCFQGVYNFVLYSFQILNSVTEELLDHIGSFKNPLDQCDYIKNEIEKLGKFITIMRHFCHTNIIRPPDKSVYWKIIFFTVNLVLVRTAKNNYFSLCTN